MRYLVILVLAAVWVVEGNPMTLPDDDYYFDVGIHDQVLGVDPNLLTDYMKLERSIRSVGETLHRIIHGHDNKHEQDDNSSKPKHPAAEIISKGIEHGHKGLQKITSAVKAPLGI